MPNCVCFSFWINCDCDVFQRREKWYTLTISRCRQCVSSATTKIVDDERASILYTVLFTNSDVYSFAATATIRHSIEYVRDANLSSNRQTFLCCVSLCSAFSHTHHRLLLLLLRRYFRRRRTSARLRLHTTHSSMHVWCVVTVAAAAGRRKSETKKRNKLRPLLRQRSSADSAWGHTREDQCACCCAATFI